MAVANCTKHNIRRENVCNRTYYKSCSLNSVSYTHLRAHETVLDLVCRLLLEKKNQHQYHPPIHSSFYYSFNILFITHTHSQLVTNATSKC
ncbi:hypothetical protein PVA38_11320 [Streptococcus pneumoniae D39]|nr:hypothetical protein PVA38_11320 [Streptococcus pneumoniae D39]